VCFWAGFDVQQTIPYGTAEEVRAEVRRLFDVFGRSDGRLMLTMGNGSTPDWPIPSIEALFDEALTYGKATVAKFRTGALAGKKKGQ
jgi:uroporphyrinogen decarboxylase